MPILLCRFLQAVDQKVSQLKELISSKRQGQPHEVIDRYDIYIMLNKRVCALLPFLHQDLYA